MTANLRKFAAALATGVASATIALLAVSGAQGAGAVSTGPGVIDRDTGRPLTDVDVLFSPATVDVNLYAGDSTQVVLSLDNTIDSVPENLSWELEILFPQAPLAATNWRPTVAGNPNVPPLNVSHPVFTPNDLARPASRDGERTLSALIIGSESTSNVIAELLTEKGYGSVTVSDDGIYTGDNPSPFGFDLVIYPDGENYGSTMPTTGQLALVEYVESGGGLITTEWVSYEVEGGRLNTLMQVLPMRRNGGGSGLITYNVDLPSHPLAAGVPTTFDVVSGYSTCYLQFGYSIFSGGDAGVTVAADESFSGRVVQFAAAGNYSGYSPFNHGENLRTVLDNAIDWVTQGRWIEATPMSGTVLANTVGEITLDIHTANLVEGTYEAVLHFVSVQFAGGFIDVPVTLVVDGDPAAFTQPTALDFGSVFVGTTHERTFSLYNSGTADLNVSSILADNPAFTALPSAVVVGPGAFVDVVVTYLPTTVADDATVLHIMSDDPNQPDLQLAISAVSQDPPVMSVFPESFSFQASTGNSVADVLTIDNGPGGSNLDYTIGVIYGGNVRATGPSAESRSNSAQHVEREKGAAETRTPRPVDRAFGGPDAYGYRWLDSESPGGPVFEWNDISGFGDNQYFYGDDDYTYVELPFAFPFYGYGMGSINISTNGYLTFWDSPYDSSGDYFPDSNTPNGIIAPLWADLHAYYASLYTWHDQANNRFIIQVTGLEGYNFTGQYSYQVVLDANGDITIHYGTVEGNDNQFAIGIEDPNGWDGLNVAFYSSYPATGKTLRFSYTSVADWLTVDSVSGSIAPGSQVQPLVTAVAAPNMVEGLYEAQIVVLSNDPDMSAMMVPVTLDVLGSPAVVLNENEITYGEVYAGSAYTRYLFITNAGTSDLLVNPVSLTAEFTVDGTELQISPFTTAALPVVFHTESTGTFSGVLELTTNDPLNALVLVNLSADAIEAPVISVDPGQFDVTLDAGETSLETLAIMNDGGSVLNWDHQIRNLQVNANRSQAIGFHARPAVDRPHARQPHPAAPGQPVGALTELGDVLDYRSDFVYYAAAMVQTPMGLMVLKENSGGESAEGGFSTDNEVHRYNPATGEDVFQFSVPPYTTAMTWDGDLLWIGDDSGNVIAYDSFGNTVGSFSLPDFYYSYYLLVHNGADFLVITPSQGRIQRVDYSGFQLSDHYYDTDLGNWNAATWVPGHHTGHLWLYDSNYADLVQVGNSLDNLAEINRIDFDYTGWTRCLAHDGQNLLLGNNWSEIWTLDDGQAEVEFFSLSPESGSVEAGTSQSTDLQFNSPGNFGGLVTADLMLFSNDPDQGEITIPLSMTVIGRPLLSVNPTELVYGDQYLGSTTNLSVQVTNDGGETLSIASVIAGLPDYVPSFTTLDLAPGESTELVISFFPQVAGDRSTLISLVSNDPLQPVFDITLSGAGLEAPEISVDPELFTEWLASGTTGDYTLTLNNSGLGDLEYNVNVTQYSVSRQNPLTQRAQDPEFVLAKGETDPREGHSPLRGAGGPDGFGYTWRDSDEPGGPLYNWYDIVSNGVGSNLFLSGDDNYVYVALPFGFPFYGTTYNEMYVSTNGLLTFGGASADYSNDPIPNTNSPDNFIAPLWDDLSGSSNYYYWHDTVQNRVIIQYENVWNLNGTGYYKMQAVLSSNGTIDFFYNNLTGTLVSSTVGIEDPSGSDGLQIAFNSPYLHNGLAVRISSVPDWMDVTPLAGTVAPGSSVDLDVHVNAFNLLDGAYDASISVTSNDPLTPEVVVPFHLSVAGFANIEVGQETIDFGTVFTGSSNTANVTVQNTGTGHLTLSGLVTNGDGFSAEAAPIVIAPGFSRQVEVYFNPTSVGTVTGSLTIENDDEDTPVVMVELNGNAIDPPVAAVNPASVTENMVSGQTLQVILTVDNIAGATDLDYTLLVNDLGGELFELIGNSLRPVKSETVNREGDDNGSRDASWMEIGPDFGTLQPGQSAQHTLTITVPLNYAGQHLGEVVLVSNDPVNPGITVPVEVNVAGIAAIAYDPTSTTFGSVFVGYSDTRQVQVSNIGSALLNVSAILGDNAVFSADPQVFSLNPGQSTDVTITFTPDSDGAEAGSLNFVSNDPDTGDASHAVSGTGTLVPVMAVAPPSMSSSLVSGQQETQNLTIDNTAGQGALTYLVSGFRGAAREAAVVPSVPDPIFSRIPGKDETDTRPSVDGGSRGQGGPDGFGYRWIDSDEAGGVVYNFVDIRNSGTQLSLSGDDSQAGLTLPFVFPFYGQNKSSALVSTNGYIGFGGSVTSYGNQLLPDASQPNDLIAPFWDDLHFRNTGRVYSQFFPADEKFIIQYTDIQRYSGSGLYTFQIVLYASGRIQFMYATMSGILTGATTGIENTVGSQGLTTAFNSGYVHNGLAVEYNLAPNWLSVLPSSGTIAAGQTAIVEVTFDATGYLDYTDDASIRVSGNDPLNPEVLVPVDFTVTGDYSLLPGQVSNPVPANNELQVNERPTLSWLPATHGEFYHVYLWPSSQAMPAAPTAITSNISYQPVSNLPFGTMYNWLVVAGNLYGLTNGPLWSFTTRTQPDLVVTTVNVPNEVFTEQEYEVSWVITNQGAGATTVPSWTDRIYISPHPGYGQGDLTYLGQAVNPSYLGSGESYANQATFAVPQGLTGEFYIHIYTDVFGQVNEGLENNNSGSSAQPMLFVLTPPPDLQVSVVTAPTNGFSGQPFTVNWTVVNEGNGPANNASWYDAVYVAPVGTSDPSQATYLGRTLHSGAMAPGGSYPSSATVTMPLENFGSQNFIVMADYENVVFEHAFESNNSEVSAPINVTLSPPSDLAVISFTHQGTAAPHEPMTLNWTVANNGFDVTETGSWQDRIYLSTDNIISVDDVVLRTTSHSGALQPGESYDAETTFNWPDNLDTERFLILKTDWNDDVFEHIFETNNVFSNAAVTPTLPDLVPMALASEGSGMSGAPLDVFWTVANQGTGGAFGDYWYDNIYISQEEVLDVSQATSLGTFLHNPVLTAGAEYTETREVAIPNGYTGTYYLHLVTDATNRVFESVETNNSLLNETTVAIVLNAWPNLQPATISVLNLNTLASGGSIEILYEVDNQGAGVIPEGTTWTDRLYLSSSPVFNANSSYILGAIGSVGPLDAGGDYTRYQAFNLPGVPAGNWYLHLVSDVSNQIYEHTNENDNVLSSIALAIANRPPSDLALTALTVPNSAGSGQMITAEYTVTNQGGATAGSSWNDGVWFSEDDQFSVINDILVSDAYHNGAVAAAATYPGSQTFRVPDGIEGNWYVFVYCDRYSSQGEPDMNNNRASAAIEISLTPAPDLVVTSFDAAATATSGQPLLLEWAISNEGEGSTRSSSIFDGAYISQNSTLDASDMQLMIDEHAAIVAPEGNYSRSRSVTIPVYLSGNYYLIFKCDTDDREYEPNKANNRVAQLLSIVQPDPSDLVVSSIVVPASAETGDPVNVSWVLENQGTNPASGEMCDGVYFSLDNVWDISDPLIGVDCRTIDIAPGGRMSVQTQLDISESMRTNEDGSVMADLPGLAPGDYYVIVRTDLRNNIRESDVSNNRTASSSTVDVDMPELALGVPEPIDIQDGQSTYYRVSVPMGETLRISVDGAEGLVYSELYLGAASVPTRSNYDYVSARPYEIDQAALVPETGATTYYVLLYGNGVHNITSPATILAQTVDFSITAVMPDHGGRGGRVTMTIEGARFDAGSTVSLEDGLGNTAPLVAHTVLDASYIRATFEIPADAPLGAWDLVVSNPARVDTRLEDGFLVEEPTGADVSFGYSRPGSMRRFGSGVYQISVVNNANNDIPVLSAILAIPAGTNYTIESDRMITNSGLFPDSLLTLLSGIPDHVDEQGWRLIPLNVRDVEVGEVIDIRLVASGVDGDVFPLKFVVDGYTRSEFLEGQLAYIELLRVEMLASGANTNLPQELVDLAAYPDEFAAQMLQAYVTLGLLTQEEVDGVTALDVSSAMATVADLPRVLGGYDNLRDLTTCQTVLTWLELVGRLGIIAIGLITGALLAPVALGLGAIMAVLGGLGLGMNIGALLTGNPGLLARIFCDETPVVASRDPNDIIGPMGYGADHFIAKNQTMPFMIRFENDPTLATAPAQAVTITQAFDSTLDLSSFRLGDFNFGPFNFDVPNNRAFFQQRLDVTDSLGIFVDFTAGLDVMNHRAFWILSSIDPNTGLAPEDPMSGFLAINDSTGAGEGFVTYTIRPKNVSVTGDVILSEARIVFDENEPIDTPEIFHTIDATGGTSHVTGFPAVSDSVAFEISWTGQDDEGGSGVASWDVYRSVNTSNLFELYQVELSDTSTVFVGSYGNTYNFFTIARDNVGNTEPMKNTAEASVFVSASGIPLALDMPGDLAFDEDGVLTLDMADYISGGGDEIVVSVDPTTDLLVAIDGMGVVITAGADWNGSELVNFVVNDEVRSTVSDFVMITVNPVNDAPVVVNAPGELVIPEDGSDCSIDLALVFGDVDGDSLSYTVEGDVNLDVQITGSMVCITPAADWNGNETLTFVANDGASRSSLTAVHTGKQRTVIANRVSSVNDKQSTRPNGAKADRDGALRDMVNAELLVTVLPQNDAPLINLPAELVFDEDGSLVVDFDSFVADVDNSTLTLSVLPTSNVQVSIDELMVTLGADADWNGSELVVFRVDDGVRTISSDTTLVVVNPVNDSPTTTNLPDTLYVSEDSGLSQVDLAQYFNDVDGDLLTYSVDGAANLTVGIDGNMLSVTPAGDWFGNESLVITADDATRTTGYWNLSLETAGTAGKRAAGMRSTGDVNMKGTARSVNGKATRGSSAIGRSIDRHNSPLLDERVGASGTLVIVVTPVNDAPAIELPPSITFSEDTVWQMNFASWISDVDSGTLGLSVAGASELSVGIVGMDVSISAPANWNGTECLVFTVDDFEGRAIDSDTLCVTVLPVNDDPEVVASLDTLHLFQGGFDQSLNLNDVFSDVDGDELAFSVSGNDQLQVELAVDGTVMISSPGAFLGQELLVFTADDGQGRVANWKAGVLQASVRRNVGKGVLVDDGERASVSEDLVVIVELQPTGGSSDLPVVFALDQNFPNPFNPTTTIRLSMPETGPARVVVYDMAGRLVKVLHSGLLSRGTHEILFDGGSLPSGVYVYRAEAGSHSATRKMALVK